MLDSPWEHPYTLSMRLIRYTLKYWIPLAAGLTVVAVLVYGAIQQSMRMTLNDPQVQMAEDAASALAAGRPVSQILPANTPKIEISESLAPFLILYDAKGSPVASGAVLHGKTPMLPDGVLEYTRGHADDRISWQPERGVRSAAVIVAVNQGAGGFFLAGRNMREVEARISLLSAQVLAGWITGLVVTFAAVAFFEYLPFTRTRE